MALDTEFGGGSLPVGWTFDDAGGAATIDNSQESADITIPFGVVRDSIFNGSSPDNSAGLVHSVSGDFDLAFMFSTIIAGTNSGQLGFILRGATDADMVRWSIYGTVGSTVSFGYARVGGVGNTFDTAGSMQPAVYLGGHGSWLRAKRVGSTYTFYMSGDGALWNEHASVTIGVDAQTVKLKTGQTGDALGIPARFDRCVDLLAKGSTDARPALGETYVTPGSEVISDLQSLPSWLSLQTLEDGTSVHQPGYIDISCTVTDGSSGRLVYTGTPIDEGGMLLRMQVTAPQNGNYLAVILAVQDGGPNIDMYSLGPGYGFEILTSSGSGETTVPIRVHRPVSNDLPVDEPYSFLSPKWVFNPTNVFWARLEKFGKRMRMRIWPAGLSEPTTWDYDGEEDALRGEGSMVPYVSIAHNPGSGGAGTLRIYEVNFYEVTNIPPVEGPQSSKVGAVPVSGHYVGGVEVIRAYLGSDLVYGELP